jgi:hypothetical protein
MERYDDISHEIDHGKVTVEEIMKQKKQLSFL